MKMSRAKDNSHNTHKDYNFALSKVPDQEIIKFYITVSYIY